MCLPKLLSRFFKKDNKTFLNAVIIFFSAIIALFSALAIILSNKEISCKDVVESMLINKTQLFVEEQYVLFERTWAITQREIFRSMGDIGSVEAYNPMVSGPYQSYNKFKEDTKITIIRY